ncbi:MAG: hypothetical protein MI754_04420, partial [Chromatiales bacterium]|nr:hypothetical protein [Chromatiales bacterium]
MRMTNTAKSLYAIEKSFLSALLIAGLLMGVTAVAANVGYDSTRSLKNISPPAEEVMKKWGVELVAVRTSAAGHMIDFRYRVIDGEKSLPLFDKELRPFLLHQKSGKSITIQNTAKVGPLRNQKKPREGRVYWMFFRNMGG